MPRQPVTPGRFDATAFLKEGAERARAVEAARKAQPVAVPDQHVPNAPATPPPASPVTYVLEAGWTPPLGLCMSHVVVLAWFGLAVMFLAAQLLIFGMIRLLLSLIR